MPTIRKHKSDLVILFATLGLMALGLIVIYAIGPMRANVLNNTYGTDYDPNYFFIGQLRSVVLSLVAFFIAEEASVSFGSAFLRVIALATPLASIVYLTNTVFQAAGRRFSSFLLSILRKGCMDIPLMFLFKSIIGMYGIVWATPTAEIGSIAVAVFLIYLMVRDIRRGDL